MNIGQRWVKSWLLKIKAWVRPGLSPRRKNFQPGSRWLFKKKTKKTQTAGTPEAEAGLQLNFCLKPDGPLPTANHVFHCHTEIWSQTGWTRNQLTKTEWQKVSEGCRRRVYAVSLMQAWCRGFQSLCWVFKWKTRKSEYQHESLTATWFSGQAWTRPERVPERPGHLQWDLHDFYWFFGDGQLVRQNLFRGGMLEGGRCFSYWFKD